MDDAGSVGTTLSTIEVATAGGYSAQQVRDLERLGVIPPALRRPNGYRAFDGTHLVALRAYRGLASAIGPVAARATMREARELPFDEAVARIVALHVGLARDREDTLAALHALDAIVDEGQHDAAARPGDALSIAELSRAIGVRASTLRFWEHSGLLTPERSATGGARSYPPQTVGEARIVAALRAAGYPIPVVRGILRSLRSVEDGDARAALDGRLTSIAARSADLLRAGTDLVALLGADGGRPDSRTRGTARPT